ncbi:hypothetical protein [Burkholderia pseudomallei]|uniref:hypothetical protein n=1 Tax=Burkholderia pseudomallei TaxID=28450 RepID=UPI00057267DC|nr:hypothetical protein [Burkholderia pseudomallei]
MQRHSLRHSLSMLAVTATLALTTAAPFAQQTNRAPQGFTRPPLHLRGHATANPGGLSPAQIWSFYGFDQLPNDYHGSEQVIAIVNAYDTPNAEADLDAFSRAFGLPPCNAANRCCAKIYATADRSRPPADAGWALERSLDVQWVHAIAPDAKIVLIVAASNALIDMMKAVATAVAVPPEGAGAEVVSMSWGGGEFLSETQYDGQFMSANGVWVKRGKATLNAVSAAEAVLYGIASASYQTSFYDVTSGVNRACGSLCNATPGYDYVTGLGRPIASNLVQALIDAP